MANDYYYRNFAEIFMNIINSSNMLKIMDEETNIDKAFSFSKDDTLHYVYSRNMYRQKTYGFELIKHLIRDDTIKVSFLTKDFSEAFGKRYKIIYEPFERYKVHKDHVQ